MFKVFNTVFSILNTESEKLTELVREHKESYGVLNSQYCDNLCSKKEKKLGAD